MQSYIDDMISAFPNKLESKVATPASANLFNTRDEVKLDDKQASVFHTIVAKGLFLCKRSRPDILTKIAFLTTRVK